VTSQSAHVVDSDPLPIEIDPPEASTGARNSGEGADSGGFRIKGWLATVGATVLAGLLLFGVSYAVSQSAVKNEAQMNTRLDVVKLQTQMDEARQRQEELTIWVKGVSGKVDDLKAGQDKQALQLQQLIDGQRRK
jgi:uncharacterized protein YlxW (UPF0749 family)